MAGIPAVCFTTMHPMDVMEHPREKAGHAKNAAGLYVPRTWSESDNPPVSETMATRVLHELWSDAMSRYAKPVEVRRALFATMSRQWQARPKELCELRTTSFIQRGWACNLNRYPQHHSLNSTIVETMLVTDEIRVLYKKWNKMRLELTEGLSGGDVYHIFVIVAGNHKDGKKYKTGRPLRPNGAERDLSKHFKRMNERYGKEPGWQELPHRIEPWRRGGAYDQRVTR